LEQEGKTTTQDNNDTGKPARARRKAFVWAGIGLFLAAVTALGLWANPDSGKQLLIALGLAQPTPPTELTFVQARVFAETPPPEAVPTPTPAPTPVPTPTPPPHPARGDVIEVDTESPVVRDIHIQLMALEYLGFDEVEEVFTEGLADAILFFQRRNDLPATGLVDEATFAALNAPEALAYAIAPGMTGEEVFLVTERLVELGYLNGEPSEVYDEETAEAVSRFRRKNKLSAGDEIDAEAFEILLGEDTVSNFFGQGDKSPEVEEYQKILYTLGYLVTEPDSVYGRLTAAAVRRFQEKNGLITDGCLGRTTLEALTQGKPPAFTFDKGMEGDDIKHIQGRLAKFGYLGEAQTTGYYGDKTALAVLSFQNRNGLAKTGAVDHKTLLKLNNDKSKRAVADTPKNNGGGSSSSGGGSSGGAKNTTGNSGDSKAKPGGSPIDYGEGIDAFIAVAQSKLGSKYVRGAKGPNSFDCSGFVYWCLNQVGVNQGYLTSIGWRTVGKYERVVSMSELKRGDVLVFSGSSSGTGHVGIYIGGGRMIDAGSSRGRVVERSIETNYWRSHFLMAYHIW